MKYTRPKYPYLTTYIVLIVALLNIPGVYLNSPLAIGVFLFSLIMLPFVYMLNRNTKLKWDQIERTRQEIEFLKTLRK